MVAARRGGKRIGYIRVSTIDQNEVRQLEGVEMDKRFTDQASGKDTNGHSCRLPSSTCVMGMCSWCIAWIGSREISTTCAELCLTSPSAVSPSNSRKRSSSSRRKKMRCRSYC